MTSHSHEASLRVLMNSDPTNSERVQIGFMKSGPQARKGQEVDIACGIAGADATCLHVRH